MPRYEIGSTDKSAGMLGSSAVNYEINPLPENLHLGCVAILPLAITEDASKTIAFTSTQQNQESGATAVISDDEIYDRLIDANDKRRLLRGLLYGFMAPHNTRDVELTKVDEALASAKDKSDLLEVGKLLDCKWFLQGEITEFSVTNIGIYSAINVAANMKIIHAGDGETAWTGKHKASSQEGTIPFSPFELAVGAVKASFNVNPEQLERVASDLARRLVRTMPLDIRNDFVVAQERRQLLQVVSSGLNMREGPGMDYPVSDILSSQEQVTFIEESKRAPWMRVRTDDGHEGYVSSLFLNRL